MEKRPKVSVIIPTYNRKDYVTEAIDSVLNQTYKDFEVIVVDDGSTDGTGEFLKERYGDGIRYFYKENGGCASARNYGLDSIDADIEYVCFLDSDDRLLPGKLSREVELLRNNPDADFTYAGSIIFDEETQREKLWQVAAAGRPENFAVEHFLTNEAKSAALLYRVNVVRNRRFREDLRYNEDSEFLQHIAIECKGVYSPMPGCWVRWHAGSKSRNLIEIHKAVLQASVDILESYPKFYHSFKESADRRIEQIRKALFAILISNKEWEEARIYAKGMFERFLANHPLSCYYYKFRIFIGLNLGSYIKRWRTKTS